MSAPLPVSALAPPLPPEPQRGEADLADAGRAFEGYLLGSVLRLGSRPLGGSAPLDGGSAGRMYRELLYEEIARLAVQRDGLGVGALLESQAGAADEPGDEE